MDPINVLVFTLAQRLKAPGDGLWVHRLPGGWRLELNTSRYPSSHADGQTIPPSCCLIYWNALNVAMVTPHRCEMALTDEDRLRIALERAVDAAREDRSDYNDAEIVTRRGLTLASRGCAITALEKTAKARRELPALTNGRGAPVKMPARKAVKA